MKNIYEILSGIGIEVPEDKKADFDKDLAANYKTVAEVEKKDAKFSSLTEQLDTAKDGLKAFEGVDVNDLKNQISRLQGDLAQKDTDYQSKLAEMEFSTLLSRAIASEKGRSAKAISALLDLDDLKSSKNQEADIKAALEELKKENSFLFEDGKTPPPYAPGPGKDPVPTAPDKITLAGALHEKYAKG